MNNKKAELEERVRHKSKDFASLFSSPQGKKVLEHLKNEFEMGDFRAKGSVEDTYFNLGRRDAIVYIEQMIKYSERSSD